MKKKTTKKRTAAKRTATKRRTTRRTHRARTAKRSKKQDSGYGWELFPFVIAIIVAIIVVAQSLDSAERYQSNVQSGMRMSAPLHGAAGDCQLSGAAERELKAAERGLQRSIQNLDEAEALYNWECATRGNDPACLSARRNLQGEHELVQQKVTELQQMKIQTCL